MVLRCQNGNFDLTFRSNPNDDFTFKAAGKTLRTGVPIRYSNFLVGGLMDLHLPFVDMIATIGPIAAISNDNVLAISNKVFVSKNSLFGERQGDVISDPIKCRQELCTAGVNKTRCIRGLTR